MTKTMKNFKKNKIKRKLPSFLNGMLSKLKITRKERRKVESLKNKEMKKKRISLKKEIQI